MYYFKYGSLLVTMYPMIWTVNEFCMRILIAIWTIYKSMQFSISSQDWKCWSVRSCTMDWNRGYCKKAAYGKYLVWNITCHSNGSSMSWPLMQVEVEHCYTGKSVYGASCCTAAVHHSTVDSEAPNVFENDFLHLFCLISTAHNWILRLAAPIKAIAKYLRREFLVWP